MLSVDSNFLGLFIKLKKNTDKLIDVRNESRVTQQPKVIKT